ncbi:MAG: AarF/UbiB family protein [Lautropia sp.]|nr:AarF/UbiB family protein [Lautropia sp.]
MNTERFTLTRDIGRLHEIATVLIRHGLGDLVRRLGLADGLSRAGHPLVPERVGDLAQLSAPQQVRMAMEELGPTFVKLGQVLAGRTDLFGTEWTDEFERLHSRVSPLPWEALADQVREDLGADPQDVFAHFDTTPLAAASIAQVHAARLKDGTEVVVKIRRPGIDQRIEADLRLLHWLAGLAETHLEALRSLHPRSIVEQFSRSLQRELDLSTECRHAEQIARQMRAFDWVLIPRPHWNWTRTRINVQDRLMGVPGNEPERLTAGNGFDRSLLARRGAECMLRMILHDDLFHADPHPGNFIYLKDNRIGLLDFGMVGHLSRRRREELVALLLGLVECRPPDVVDVLQTWAASSPDRRHMTDTAPLEDDIEAFVLRYRNTPLGELDLGQMMSEVAALLRQHGLSLPSDLALLVKAFISLEGIGRSLDPGFNLVTEVMPQLRDLASERYHPKALASRGWRTLRRSLDMIEALPDDLIRMMRQIRAGQFSVQLDVRHLQRLGNQIDHAATRLSMALVIAALIIGTSIMMTVSGGPTLLGFPALGLGGFIAAAAGGIWLLRSIWRSERHDDRDER